MSTEVVIKGFFAAFFSLIFTWMVFSRYDVEVGSEQNCGEKYRYAPGISGALLPLCTVVLAVLGLFYYGARETARITLSWCFTIFLQISLYYIVLIPILPFLRKHISARACALLWLLPNELFITQQSYMQLPKPLLVLRAPGMLVWIFFFVWLAGFLGVLLWKTISHLIFRRHILRNAVEVDAVNVLALWKDELEQAGICKFKGQLVISPDVTTPLSIGLFRRTIRVVLPEHTYAPDELALIFRHEIVHISREDAWAKFFLIFCTAMCWFNPLMWIAMRKSADDLELSCDETVLLKSDDADRRKYATLLLNTASDERGFTTCLSASASAMRYRLKNIMKPGKRHSGALVVGLTFFVLCMSCGYVALAYDSQTGADVIFQSRDAELFTLNRITSSEDDYHTYTTYKCTDTDALYGYFSSLTLENLTGNYSFSEYERQYSFLYLTPEGTTVISLSDQILKLVPLYGEDSRTAYYYLPDGADWEYLDAIITPSP